MQTSLTITWGQQHAITYVLSVTSAPKNYDGFGTLTLYSLSSSGGSGKELERYVLIQTQHAAWQEGRYRSGLYRYEPSDALSAEDVSERLYKAMVASLDAEAEAAGAWGSV